MNIKRLNSKKTLKYSLIAFSFLILFLLNIASTSVFTILNKIDRDPNMNALIPDNLDAIELEYDPYEQVSGSDTFSADDMQALDNELNQNGALISQTLKSESGVTNILVLGIDARTINMNSIKSRSDVIIVLSINDNTKSISMTSIMRDCYVDIPGREKNNKINAACRFGGPALAAKTVENTFGIKIDHYVIVNFYAFMDVVDTLGGITADISSNEKNTINKYIREVNSHLGLDPNAGSLTQTGEGLTLTGKQAMGYVRDRYDFNATSSENYDFGRTARQREVLTQLIDKARNTDYQTLIGIVDSVADNMATDMSNMDIFALAAGAANYRSYSLSQFRIPANQTYVNGVYEGQSVLRITDLEANRKLLREAIYGQ